VRNLAVLSTKAAADIGRKDPCHLQESRRGNGSGRASLEEHEASDVMKVDWSPISKTCSRSSARNSRLLLEVITEVDENYEESVNRLSQALGHIQFQDVMRQRMEHVQEAHAGDARTLAVSDAEAMRSCVGRFARHHLQGHALQII
jgi:methyl-accepting chemotaxis protein